MSNQTEGHAAPAGPHMADSEAQAAPEWRQRAARSTPLLLWGLGDSGQAVARRLTAALAACFPTIEQIQLFQPQDHPLTEWRDWLAQQAEHSLAHDAVLEVAIVVAAREFTPPQQELLWACEQSLAELPTGRAALTLAVLLPAKASAAERQELETCFEMLDQWTPATVCLNPILLCRNAAQPPEADAGLLEQLFRALVDADLSELLRRAGQGAGYCALGMQQLATRPDALLEHVEARLQNEIFWRGLVNLHNLTPSERTAVQTRAEQLLADCNNGFTEQFQQFPEAVPNLPAGPLAGDEARQARAVFEEEFDAAQRQIGRRLEPLGRELETRLRTEFAAVLATDAAHFTAARLFLEALDAGLAQAREEFWRKPLRAGANAFYEARIEKWISTFRLPLAPAGRHTTEGIAAAVQALHAATDGSTAQEHIAIRFLTKSWDSIQSLLAQPKPEPADARRLLSATCEFFFAEALPLAAQRQETRRLWQAMQGADLPQAQHRLFSTPAPDEQSAARLALTGLEQEKNEWHGPYAALYRFYLSLVSELLWPQIVRLLIIEEFSRRLHGLTLEFTGFWAGAGAICAERWREAERLPAAAAWVTPVGGATRLETLDSVFGASDPAVWKALAAQALNQPPPAYFQAGSVALAARLAEFSAARCATLRARDVLAWLELKGSTAQALVRHALQQAETEAAFTLLATARLQSRRVRAIQSAAELRPALQSRYRDCWKPDDVFLDSKDPQTIDLTVFTLWSR